MPQGQRLAGLAVLSRTTGAVMKIASEGISAALPSMLCVGKPHWRVSLNTDNSGRLFKIAEAVLASKSITRALI